MSDIEGLISTFVSPLIRRTLVANPDVVASERPVEVEVFASVLMIDITGFTRMTEKYERLGPDGVEALTAELDRFFGIMIARILGNGGEVAGLSGDALLAYWPANSPAEEGAVVRSALITADDLREELSGAALDSDTQLKIHASLSAGLVRRLFVGGHDNHRLSVITGNPMQAMGELLPYAQPGELILSSDAYHYVEEMVEGDFVSADAYRLTSVQHSTTTTLAPASGVIQAPAKPAIDAGLARRFLPQGLRRQLDAGHEDWLAGIRPLSVAFLSTPTEDENGVVSAEQLHVVAAKIQEITHGYGGVVQELVHDDKGMVFLIVFGLPMLSHEDDALRAILACQDIRAELARIDVNVSVGVGSGMSYCGLLGTDDWRCYSVRGSVVNRAARLMGMAGGEVLVDDATRSRSGERVAFGEKRLVDAKGLDEPIAAYPAQTSIHETTPIKGAMRLVGRGAEIDRIASALSAFETDGTSRTIIVEGEPGIGKTALLDKLEQLATSNRLFRSQVDALELGAVYRGWRGFFQPLVRTTSDATDEQRLQAVASILPASDAAQQRAPLLAPVLQMAMRDTALTSQMTSVVRAENTDELMLSVIRNTAQDGPIILIIDDCQWMDTASWRLLRKVLDEELSVLLVLGMRTERENAEAPVARLLENAQTEHLQLAELDHSVLDDLIASILNVEKVPEALVQFVKSRSGGNPYYTFELIQALLEQEHIQIVGGEVLIAGGASALRSIVFPDSVERVIVSRVDRLEPDVQLTLKVASVIGRQFLFHTLSSIHPLKPSQIECHRFTNDLVTRGLTPLLAGSDMTYFFRHLITHQTVYNLLAFAYRRELHLEIANWIEANIKDADVTMQIVLANHFVAAQEYERAFPYLEEAGEAALNTSSYGEASDLYDQAVDAMKNSENPPDPVKQAKVYFGLGEVYMRTGKVDESYESFCKGLDVLGVKWPREKNKVGLGILKSLGTQALYRLRGRRPDPTKPVSEREMVLANGLEQFSYLFFFSQRFDEMFLTNVQSLNFTEQANSAPAVKKRLTQMAANLSIGGAVGPSDFYLRKADAIPGEDSSELDIASGHLFRALAYCGQARYGECADDLLEGIEIAQRLGNKRLELDLRSFYARNQFELGRHEEALRLNEEYLAEARSSDDQAQHQCFAVYSTGQCKYRWGDLEAGLRDLETAREQLLPNYDLDRLLVHGVLSYVDFRRGQYDAAWTFANEALELAERSPPTGFYLTDAYSHITSTFIEFHENVDAPSPVSSAETLALAGRALKTFGVVAKKFASNRPRFLVMNGRYLSLCGKPAKAVASIQKGIDLADELKMAFESASGQLVMGGLVDLEATARAHHLEAARRSFKDMGYQNWVATAEEVMARQAQ